MQIAYGAGGASNGGLPSGRSRSPGFDVDQTKTGDASSSSNNNSSSGGGNAASVFLAGATLVTGNSATSSSVAGGGGGGGGGVVGSRGGWGPSGLGSADDSRKDVDHAFAGAMLQRSTSAPPMSDHVREM